MLQSIRRHAFWFADKLNGGIIARHKKNISQILEGDNSFKEQKKNDAWINLANHAVESVPFYEKNKNYNALKDFPVVNKTIIRENFSEFKSASFKQSELIPITTSGSTGTPFKIYHNKDKKARNTADTLFFAEKAGYRPGQELIYLKIWAEEKMAHPIKYKLQNVVPVDVIKMSDEQIEKLIANLEKKSGKRSFVGYVSAFESICRYLDRKNKVNINCDVTSIITTSESLTDYVKNKMQFYFGAEVLARYSNLENGILAQQVYGSEDRFLINSASYIIELMDINSDEPVNLGEPGRIVVTDLYNRAMPMIRYDTGDIGVWSKQSDRYGNSYLDRIEGRKLDILYDTSGEIISSYIMYKNMWKYTEIKQYQLIQEGQKDYRFKINVNDGFEKGDQLRKEFKKYLGHDANFIIDYIDEIPLLSSGKRKKTVNNWKQ